MVYRGQRGYILPLTGIRLQAKIVGSINGQA